MGLPQLKLVQTAARPCRVLASHASTGTGTHTHTQSSSPCVAHPKTRSSRWLAVHDAQLRADLPASLEGADMASGVLREVVAFAALALLLLLVLMACGELGNGRCQHE